MIGLVGAGQMGGALLRGWLKHGRPPGEVVVVDPNPGEVASQAIAEGARHGEGFLGDCDTVVLAIKPQMFAQVAPNLAPHIAESALVVSILAGTRIATLQAALPGRAVVRAMPNTPASLGRGVSGLFAPVSDSLAARARAVLEPAGAVVRVESERDLDRVTAVSGSGPAYVFHMVEALEHAAREVGLANETARQLARHTLVGAAALLEGGEAGALREAVTSPNGTTQAGLEVLMAELPDLVARTVEAAFRRAEELGGD